ncbi:MAG: histidine phosphatase family protein [Burkholderiaceae bacterium]
MQSALPRLFVFCLACFFLGAAPSFAEQRLDASALQNALAVPGTVVLIRHSATFSGIGDPDNFRLEDCSTQRNLSPEGRAQARAFGQWFRDRGLTPSAVRSSQWCRCLDTATEAFRGQPSTQPWEALNSFFQGHGHWPTQRDLIRKALADPQASGVTAKGFEVWVTHQVLISSLTGVYLSMGELVVARPVRSAQPSVGAAGPVQWQVVGRAFIDKGFQ